MGKAHFAAVPLRALGDPELTDGDLRVLAVVAAYDRLSRARGKGQGAWASHATMAGWLGRNYANFSTVMNKLLRLGYLLREPRVSDRRQFTYRVVYTDDDTIPSTNDVCRRANDREEMVCPTKDESDEIVCPGDPSKPQKTANSAPEYIPQRVVIDSAEAEERYSTEVAEACASARTMPAEQDAYERDSAGRDHAGLGEERVLLGRLPRNFPDLRLGAQLSRIERAFGQIGRDATRLGGAEREVLCEWLFDASVGDGAESDRQRAQRLLAEISDE